MVIAIYASSYSLFWGLSRVGVAQDPNWRLGHRLLSKAIMKPHGAVAAGGPAGQGMSSSVWLEKFSVVWGQDGGFIGTQRLSYQDGPAGTPVPTKRPTQSIVASVWLKSFKTMNYILASTGVSGEWLSPEKGEAILRRCTLYFPTGREYCKELPRKVARAFSASPW
jgi:hypothetical protein